MGEIPGTDASVSAADAIPDLEDLQPGEGTSRLVKRDVVPAPRVTSRRTASEDGGPGAQRIWVHTWGCGHNNSDGEYMAGLLHAHGYQLVDRGEDADLWVLNSCTVKNPSEASLNNAIDRAKALGKHLVVAGCVPQASPSAYGAYSILGVQQIDRVVEVVEETLKGHTVRLMKERKAEGRKLGGASLDLPKIRRNALIEIVPINTGCLNQCTYCKTKHARGDLGSYHPDEIVARVAQVLDEGVVEVWLTSEDTGAYGRDIGATLPDLLLRIADAMRPGTRLRLGMTNPPYILEHLAALVPVFMHPRVYRFLHVPVQAASDRVLAAMKREYTRADFCEVVDYLREHVPGITIATDVICGFPTETAEEFDETLALLAQYEFPVVNISQFYARPGTPAKRMQQVASEERKRRSRLATALFHRYHPYAGRVGQTYTALVTEVAADGKHYVAHNMAYEQILVPMKDEYLGRELEVVVTAAGKFHMVGDVLRVVPNDDRAVRAHRAPARSLRAGTALTTQDHDPQGKGHTGTAHAWLWAAALLALLVAWRVATRAAYVQFSL